MMGLTVNVILFKPVTMKTFLNTLCYLMFVVFTISSCNDSDQSASITQEEFVSEEHVLGILQENGFKTDSLSFTVVKSSEIDNFLTIVEKAKEAGIPLNYHPRPDGRLLPDEQFESYQLMLEQLIKAKPYQDRAKELMQELKEKLDEAEYAPNSRRVQDDLITEYDKRLETLKKEHGYY